MKITAIRARSVLAPMNRPVITGGGSVDRAAFVLVDLETDAGPVGRSYVFAISPVLAASLKTLIEGLGAGLVGRDCTPRPLHEQMWKSMRLAGAEGFIGWAIAGIDMAAWDAFGQEIGQPLYRIIGGERRAVAAYNSNGLGLIGPDALGAEAAALAEGYGAVKLRLGYPDLATDIAAVEAVMDAVPQGMPVMCDYNQCLNRSEAKVRISALDDLGLAWIEEPLAHDDVEGYANLCASFATPIQLGENARSAAEIQRLIAAEAADYLMPDVAKIGGITGWLMAAAHCAAGGVQVSSHLFPEVTLHMLAASRTAHWLECVDWAEPFLARRIEVVDGLALPFDVPGTGIAWDEDAISKMLI